MSYIKVNGYDLPYPKRGVKPIVTTVVNAGRNANGVVVGQRIGRDQYKLDGLEWSWLTAEQWSYILNLISDFYFYVTFPDPVNNQPRTVKMYCGDRSTEPYWVDSNGEPTHYLNCKVNFIDTGE